MSTVAKKKKPLGLYICSLSWTFERASFYTVRYMLAIWIATDALGGGLGFTKVEAASMAAAFTALSYITPLLGGYIADHFISPRICIPVGMVMMGIGYLFAWQAKGLGMVWAMILLVSVGSGLFKSNLSGVNGLQFKDQKELNTAFSIQYMFINIGSFIGTTFFVLLVGPWSFAAVFAVCGVLMFVDAVWFVFGAKKALGDLGKKPFKHDERKFTTEKAQKKEEAGPLTSREKKRVAAIILVTLFSALFWIVWYLAYNPVYYYFGYGSGDEFLNWANWQIGNFKIPTSYFDSVNALVCIILAPTLAILWERLANRPQGDLSMFKKTALGMILVGFSFVVLVLANIVRGDGQASILWIVLVSILMSIGEMVFSPLGNAFISRFAPAKVMGLLLGFWPIAVFLATNTYPKLFAILENVDFNIGYGIVAAVVIVAGVALWAMSGKLDALATEES